MLPFPLHATRPGPFARLLALSLVVVASSGATPAPQADAMSARLEVAANPACTTRADVVARVHARSPRVTFVDDDSVLALRARFSTLPGGGVAGDLTLVRPGAVPSTRRVVAQSCAEAADAVALIIAVTLDPTSVERAEQDNVGATRGGPGATSSEQRAAEDVSRAPPAKPRESSAPAVPVSVSSDERRDASPSTGSFGRPRFGLVLAGQSFFGPTPGLMPGLAAYVTVGIERPALWSPAVLLGVTHAWRSGVEEPGGTASFTLDAVSLDACPLRFRASVLDVAPCASLLGGRLAARGSDTNNPANESARPFWVLGPSGVVTAALVWRLEASARVAVGVNLVRDAFEFTPVVFHTVGPVTVAASLGLGVRTR